MGNGGNKTFKQSEQSKKVCKKLFSPRQFYTLYQQKFSNMRPIISITFPQSFRKYKKVWTLESMKGGQKDRKSKKHQYKKSCSVRQNSSKNKHFLRRVLQSLIVKVFKSDTNFSITFPQGFQRANALRRIKQLTCPELQYA